MYNNNNNRPVYANNQMPNMMPTYNNHYNNVPQPHPFQQHQMQTPPPPPPPPPPLHHSHLQHQSSPHYSSVNTTGHHPVLTKQNSLILSYPRTRVKLNEKYVLPSPINVPDIKSHTEEISELSFDFSFEREVLNEHQNVIQFKNSPRPLNWSETSTILFNKEKEILDPWESKIQELMNENYSREEVCLALIMTSIDDSEKIKNAINNYRELLNMGFVSSLAIGALLTHDGNLELAADSLFSNDRD